VSNHPNQGSAAPTIGPTIRSGRSHSGAVPAAGSLLGLAIGTALFALAAVLGLLFSSAAFGYPSRGLA
jgi:hypothetical protein